MKGKLTIGSLVCVIAAASASIPLGSAAVGSERTITAIQKGTGIAFVDADRNGMPSIGDYEVGTAVYVKPASGKAIGRSSVVCTQINAAGTQYQCQGLSHFSGGDVISAGLFSATAKTYSQAVIGGTGVYSGVTGVLKGTFLDATFSRTKVTFTLHS